ncbi:hypothetical protein BD414DRAFT_525456 [Trametes punicea]|nr:hypothetical protein BD414DRAFT_525456 [Trametes punicea]
MRDVDPHAERRWSELIPPHTALTFAAIWDPEEGMVTFSGAHLFDSGLDKSQNAKGANDSPYDVPDPDGQSQVLTIDPFNLASYSIPSAGLDSFAYARDALVDAETVMDSRSCLALAGNSVSLRVPPGIHTVPDSPAAASSMALASLVNPPFRKSLVKELVERGKQAYHTRSRRPEIRVHAPDDDASPYDPKHIDHVRCAGRGRAESDKTVTDEGFFEDDRLTHQTLGTAPVLVDVNLDSHRPPRSPQEREGAPSEHESSWTTLRDVERDICFNVPLETRRRLKKPRSQPSQPSSQVASRSSVEPASPSSPADPAEVLARRFYNHVPVPSRASPSSASTAPGSPRTNGGGGTTGHRPSLRRTKELLQRVVSCKKGDEDDRWVCVEVQHKVKQRVCAVNL